MSEISRRLDSREEFAIAHVSLRQIDAYRQDYGRMGVDQFAVVVSSLLRRHDAGFAPASFGYLDDGSFIVIGDEPQVTEIMANSARDFEVLAPAFYDNTGMFGAETTQADGPSTWVGVHGGLIRAKAGGYDNLLQIGYALSDVVEWGESFFFGNGFAGQETASTNLAA
jgi:hypothetical protein